MKLRTGAPLAAAASAVALAAVTVATLGASGPAAAPTMPSPPHARPTVTPLVHHARLNVQAMPPELTAAPFPH